LFLFYFTCNHVWNKIETKLFCFSFISDVTAALKIKTRNMDKQHDIHDECLSRFQRPDTTDLSCLFVCVTRFQLKYAKNVVLSSVHEHVACPHHAPRQRDSRQTMGQQTEKKLTAKLRTSEADLQSNHAAASKHSATCTSATAAVARQRPLPGNRGRWQTSHMLVGINTVGISPNRSDAAIPCWRYAVYHNGDVRQRRRHTVARTGPTAVEQGRWDAYFRPGLRPTCWRLRARCEPRTCTLLRLRQWSNQRWVDRFLHCILVGCEHSTLFFFRPTSTTGRTPIISRTF